MIKLPIKKLLLPSGLLCALLFFLPFERIPSLDVAGITLRINIFIGLALILVTGFKHWSRPGLLTVEKLGLFMLLVFFVSALQAMNLGRSLSVIGFTIFVVLLALAIARSFTVSDLHRMQKWLIAGALVVCGFAFYQFFGDIMQLPHWATGLRPFYTIEVFSFPRVQAASLEPLYFANYLLLPLALSLALAIYMSFPLWIIALFYTCFFLTVSRGGIVAALLLTLLFIGIGIIKKRGGQVIKIVAALFGGAAMAYVMIVLLIPQLGNLRTSLGSKVEAPIGSKVAKTYQKQATNYEYKDTGSDRARTRAVALELFQREPILGVGPGNFGREAKKLRPYYSEAQTVNNLPLELLAETGLAGAAAFVLFAAALLWKALTVLRKLADGPIKVWLVASFLFLIAAFLQYQTFSTLYIIHIWAAVGVILGLIRLSRANEKA
ncbi:MAG TPA: O-antigen ligase family protein [Candidatus Dormibacteraeota bacterium]|nr:O-antigen ligase family protein [Candidatus Dormibacteraeota bacterium]